MATLIATANGNFTSAATWGVAEAGSGAVLTSASVAGSSTTSYVYGTAFTGTNTKVCDGVALFLKRANSTGTFDVALSDDNGTTATRSVQVNASDLPADESWVFFKFGSTLTLDGGTDYKVGIKTSSGSSVTVYRDATAGNWGHVLRLTDTAAPAAGDVMLICGEWTAAATTTTRTVTMNSAAATDYGSNAAQNPTQTSRAVLNGLEIGQGGTLAWRTPTTVTMTIASPGVITWTSHGFVAQEAVVFTTTGALPTGITAGTTYYVVTASITANTFQVSATPGGAAINTTGSQSGTHSGTQPTLTLQLSGNLIVWSGGTHTMGTTGTPCPRVSTMTLQFDCAADGDFGSWAFNGSTDTRQGLSRTSGKDVWNTVLNADAAANATSLTVLADTGWLDNDRIAVASTTRTPGDSETGLLNGAAGASTLTVDGFGGAGGGLLVAHSGTSPTQGEIILLTRAVKHTAVSAGVVTFANIGATATVDWDWVEFSEIGENATNKKGIDIATTTGSFSMQFCSIWNAEDMALNVSSASGSSIEISNNAFWNLNTAAAAIGALLFAATSGSYTVSGNIVIKNSGTNGCFSLSDVGINVINNTVVSNAGASAAAYSFSQASATGSFSGNVAHSNAGYGFLFSTAGVTGTINNSTIWRNGADGVRFTATCDVVFDTITLFGNTTHNIQFPNSQAATTARFINLTSSGDSTFSTTNGITISNPTTCRIINGDFSTVSGIKVAHTNDINVSIASSAQVTCINTKLGAATEVATQTNLYTDGFIKSAKHDQTSGSHKTWKQNGTITRDTTTYRTASPSERLVPLSATLKLESGSRLVPIDSGSSVTVSCYVRKSVVGDSIGANYNGTQARLILKRNDAVFTAPTATVTMTTASPTVVTWTGHGLIVGQTVYFSSTGALPTGITGGGTPYFITTVVDANSFRISATQGGSDVNVTAAGTGTITGSAPDRVLALTAAAIGNWEQLSASTSLATVTDDGVLEFVVDCDGTTGAVYIDDWSVV